MGKSKKTFNKSKDDAMTTEQTNDQDTTLTNEGAGEGTTNTSADQTNTDGATQDNTAGDTGTTEQPIIIQPTAATPDPTVISTDKAEVTDLKTGSEDPFQNKIDELLKSGTELQKTILLGLEQYKHHMNPKRSMSEDDGAMRQKQLWSLIKAMLQDNPNTTEKEFKGAWNLLAEYFKENQHRDGVFHERYANRFIQHHSWHNRKEVQAFTAVLDLIRASANGDQNKIAISNVIEKGFNETATNRLIAIYGKK